MKKLLSKLFGKNEDIVFYTCNLCYYMDGHYKGSHVIKATSDAQAAHSQMVKEVAKNNPHYYVVDFRKL